MANNLLKTFPLTGGEDAVNYDTGYKRIDGYRQLVSGPLPGHGPVRGLVVYGNHIYLFQDKDNGTTTPTAGGMWRATVDIYHIGSEANKDDQSLWGVNIIDTAGSWTPITNINQPRVNPLDEDEVLVPIELLPGGYYEFVISNFQASVASVGEYIGGYSAIVSSADTKYIWKYGDLASDDGEDSLNVTPIFGGDIGDIYICKLRHEVNTNSANTPVSANWVKVEDEAVHVDHSHDVSVVSGLLYGVDGVNPAFEFDSLEGVDGQVVQIDSRRGVAPHHIESLQNRLWIGFRSGLVAFSSDTNPADFNVVHGAGGYPVQDALTGLSTGPDGTMFIFTKDKVYLLTGLINGADINAAALKKYSKDVGAFPYTALALAGHTFFYDTWGLTELESSDTFGDVVTNSLSTKIQKILQGFQPVKAVISRARAQYKLYFRSADLNYSTTVLDNTIIRGENLGFSHSVYPFSITHGDIGEVQEPTEDWNFHSVKEWHVVGVKQLDSLGVEEFQVHQMDIGNSFNGKKYQSFMTLPFNFLGSPHRVKKFRKMMLNIDCTSDTKFNYTVDFAFGANSTPKETGGNDLPPSGAAWSTGVWSHFYWGTGYTSYLSEYINGFGENVSVTIMTDSDRISSHTLKDISFVYQNQRIEH